MSADRDQKLEKPAYSMYTTFRKLFALVQHNRPLYALIIALAIGGSIVSMITPLLVQDVVNLVASGASMGPILHIVVEMIFLALAEVTIATANAYAMTWISIQSMFLVRNKMFQHLQKLSFTYFHTTKIGKIISYVTNDVETINTLVNSGLITVIVQIFQLGGSIIFMLALSVQMSIIPLCIMPVNLIFLSFFATRFRRYYVDIRRAVSTVTGQAQETVDGFRTIKGLKSEALVVAKFEESARKELDANMRAATLQGAQPAVFNTITFIGIGSVVFLGGYLYFTGVLPLSNIGLIFAFIMYLQLFLGPIGSLSQFFSDVQNAVVGAGRVLRLLAVKPEMEEPANPVPVVTINGDIVFDHVTFAYGEAEVIHDLSLHVHTHERMAIVGPTGAGKTTLVSLIPRFYDVKAGSIKIDGTDVRDFATRELRKAVGLVLQDNFLFSTTIMENIRYGRPDATDGEVIEAAKKVGAHEFIADLPKAYQTQIGERGVILSIGQRQLLAFARTVLVDPPILILDEATSAVDAYSEIIIQRSLEKLLANRTSIIIAHRMSTIVNSDTIIVLKDGRIMQKGNHQSLIAERGGLYRVLYNLQFAESKTKEIEIYEQSGYYTGNE
jgi:ABC-type multidrug transport system fused ATPase/permease subunit